MTPEDARPDAMEALSLFMRMDRRELQGLRRALVADLRWAVRPESIAFAGGRVALIDFVLRGKNGERGSSR